MLRAVADVTLQGWDSWLDFESPDMLAFFRYSSLHQRSLFWLPWSGLIKGFLGQPAPGPCTVLRIVYKSYERHVHVPLFTCSINFLLTSTGLVGCHDCRRYGHATTLAFVT